MAHPLVAVHTAWMPHSYRTSSMPAWHMLIMKIARCRTPPERCRTPLGHLPDALESGVHGVRTRWIPGFMAFQLARYTQTVLLCRSHGSLLRGPRCGPRDQQAACSMVPVGTAVPVRAVVRKQIAGPFGSPTVPSDLPSSRVVRPCRPLAPNVPSTGSGVLRPGGPPGAGLGS